MGHARRYMCLHWSETHLPRGGLGVVGAAGPPCSGSRPRSPRCSRVAAKSEDLEDLRRHNNQQRTRGFSLERNSERENRMIAQLLDQSYQNATIRNENLIREFFSVLSRTFSTKKLILSVK